MNIFSLTQKSSFPKRLLCGVTAFFFLGSTIFPNTSMAQTIPQTVLNLPVPGTMVLLSPRFTPTMIKGMTIYPDDPFKFDFIIDKGDTALEGEDFKAESAKLIKYFLASLTTPEEKMWVNLSPHEKDRIIADGFDTTEMGRDLLAQDYILKQLTASLLYPENELGKSFWNKVYVEAKEKLGTSDIPLNTFNKVWIIPERAEVYVHGKSAFVVGSHLKVMLEEEYLGKKIEEGRGKIEDTINPSSLLNRPSSLIKEIIIPAIEKEINEGKNFAQLRQIYHSLILATWYKKNLKKSLFGQVYVDKNKTKGVDVEDKQIKQKIYEQYLAAFKKGAYDYIKEDYDPETQEVVSKKYFSGGFDLAQMADIQKDQAKLAPGNLASLAEHPSSVTVAIMTTTPKDPAMMDAKEDQASSKSGLVRIAALPRTHSIEKKNQVYNNIVISQEKYLKVREVLYSFKEYMDQALHNPRWGYYSKRVNFSRAPGSGDFTTYPIATSPFFGQALAEKTFKMWDGMRKAGTLKEDETFSIVEFGAGEADAAHDFMNYISAMAQKDGEWKKFWEQIEYRIYERSQLLREKQQRRMAQFSNKVKIFEGDARNPKANFQPEEIKGLIFTNEVPDAFGVHKIFLSRHGTVDAVFPLPYIEKEILKNPEIQQLLMNSDWSSYVLEMGSNKVKTQLGLPQDENLIYFSKETFNSLLGDLSEFNETEELAKFVDQIKFREVYAPAALVPEVIPHIESNLEEYAELAKDEDVVLYMNTWADDFFTEAGEILKAGYVVTIDYGDRLSGGREGLTRANAIRTFQKGISGINPYLSPGLKDITTDQNFTAFAVAGKKSGLSPVFFGNQNNLLSGLPQIRETMALRGGANPMMDTFVHGNDIFKIFVQKKDNTDKQYAFYLRGMGGVELASQKERDRINLYLQETIKRDLYQRLQRVADPAMMSSESGYAITFNNTPNFSTPISLAELRNLRDEMRNRDPQALMRFRNYVNSLKEFSRTLDISQKEHKEYFEEILKSLVMQTLRDQTENTGKEALIELATDTNLKMPMRIMAGQQVAFLKEHIQDDALESTLNMVVRDALNIVQNGTGTNRLQMLRVLNEFPKDTWANKVIEHIAGSLVDSMLVMRVTQKLELEEMMKSLRILARSEHWGMSIAYMNQIIGNPGIDRDIRGMAMDELMRVYEYNLSMKQKQRANEILKLIVQHNPRTKHNPDAFLFRLQRTLALDQLDQGKRNQIISAIDDNSSQGRQLSYLILKKFNRNEQLLSDVVKNNALDIRVRLFAFGLLANHEKMGAVNLDFKNKTRGLIEALKPESSIVANLLDSPMGREEAQTYTVALLLKIQWDSKVDIFSDRLNFKDRINGAMRGYLDRGHDNMYSNFRLGSSLMRKLSDQELAMVLIHEWGHNVLTYDFDFQSEVDNLRNTSIHETLADVFALTFAAQMGWSTKNYKDVTSYKESEKSVQQIGYAVKPHTAARAQLTLIERYANLQTNPKDWGILLKSMIEELAQHYVSDTYDKFIYHSLKRYTGQMDGRSLASLRSARGKIQEVKKGQILIVSDDILKEIFGVQAKPSTADPAMLITKDPQTPGGIDLNPNKMDLQTKGENAPLYLPVDPAMLESMSNIDGVYPVIINVAPVTNLQFLLGIADPNLQKEKPTEVSFNLSSLR